MKERSQSQDPGWPGRGPEAGRVHTYMYCEREQANVFYHFTRSYLASYIVSITYVVGPTYRIYYVVAYPLLLKSSHPSYIYLFIARSTNRSQLVHLFPHLHRPNDSNPPSGQFVLTLIRMDREGPCMCWPRRRWYRKIAKRIHRRCHR